MQSTFAILNLQHRGYAAEPQHSLEATITCSGRQRHNNMRPVQIQPFRGDAFQVHPTSTSSLKALIRETLGVPEPLQVLSHGVLGPDLCQDTEEVQLSLDLSSSFPLRFRVLPVLGSPFSVCVRLSESVREMKNYIGKVIGAETVRLAQGESLWDDESSIADVYVPGQFAVDCLLPEDFFITVRLYNEFFQVAVSPQTTIDQIKLKVTEKSSINTASQSLFLRADPLFGDQTIQSCNITADSVLYIKIKQDQTVWAHSTGLLPVKVTIGQEDGVELLSQKLKNNSSLVLLFRGAELSDAQSLKSAGIADGAIVEVGETVLVAMTSNIERVQVAVMGHLLVSELKQALARKLLLPADALLLVYQGQVLHDTHPVSHYVMPRRAMLEVIETAVTHEANLTTDTGLSNPSEGDAQKLYSFVNIEGKQITLRFEPSCNIETARSRLVSDFGMKDTDFLLIYSNCVLKDHLRLSDIIDDPTHMIYVHDSQYPFIFLKTQHSRLLFVPLSSMEITVSDLKAICLKVFPDPAGLYYHKVWLEDHNRLSDYSIASGTCLRVLRSAELAELTDSSSGVTLSHPKESFAYLCPLSGEKRIIRFWKKDSLHTLYSLAAAIMSLPYTEILLIANGEKVKSNAQVCCNCIEKASEIQLVTQFDKAIVVSVQKSDVIIEVSYEMLVDDVIDFLCLPLDAALTHNFILLDRSRTVESYGLTPLSDLHGLDSKAFCYHVSTPTSIALSLCFPKRPSEAQVKFRIEMALGIPLTDQTLLVNNALWRDTFDYPPETQIQVMLPRNLMLTVSSLRCLNYTFFVQSNILVSDFKLIVADHFDMIGSNIRLYHNNQELVSDNEPLDIYYLPMKCELMMLFPQDVIATITNFSMSVTTTPMETVHKFLARLESRVGKGGLLSLNYKDIIMDAQKTFIEYGIKDHFSVRVIEYFEKPIKFQLASGEHFTATVPVRNILVFALALTVERQTGVAASHQSLSWTGYLPDKLPFLSYGVNEDSLIIVKPQHYFNYSSHVIITSFGQQVCILPVSGNASVGDVKSVIEKRMNNAMRVIVAEQLVGDEVKLKDTNLGDGTIEVIPPEGRVATICTPTGDRFSHGWEAHTTVEEVKKQIEHRTSIPVAFQRLVLSDWELSGDISLGELGDNLELQVECNTELVIVERVNKDSMVVEIPVSSSAGLLKVVIGSKIKAPSSSLRLYFDGQLLSDYNTLESYGVHPGSKVTLLNPDETRLYVKSPLSRPFSIFVKKHACCADIKAIVANKLERNQSSFQLVVNVKVLRLMRGFFEIYQSLTLRLSLALPPDTLIVFLETSPNNTIPIQVSKNERIEEVRAKVKRRAQQAYPRLLAKSKELDDTLSVSESGLTIFDTISLA